MTQIPPSRWKVVEQGRRLVVIDTLTGKPAVRETAVPPPPLGRADTPLPVSDSPRGVDDKSGRAVIRTSRLFDLKGPREIVVGDNMTGALSGGTAVAVIFAVVFIGFAMTFPLLWFLPVFVLFQPKARNALRSAITVWLDSLDQAGT